ncbi:MAG: YSC84-related protein [Steroidobacteraceae bacterium]
MNQFARALKPFARICLLVTGLALLAGPAFADSYSDTVSLFKEAGASARYFRSSYGYAVFPTVGKGGFVVGGARGKGRVYRHGRFVGDTTVTQLSVGFQAGAQAYSEIIFFQTRLDLARFESGKYALGAQASAVAITASASASTSTEGTSAGASGTEMNAVTTGRYIDGVAVFTIGKGGLMYEAAVAGQKFTYDPRN